jgi:hypothetical protein
VNANFFKWARGKAQPRRERGVMNKTEAAYAVYLTGLFSIGEILGWQFESVTLTLGAKCRFTPDFFVQNADGSLDFHEVKGTTKSKATGRETAYKTDDAGVKIKVAAQQYQMFRFYIVYKTKDGVWQKEEQ